MTEAPINLLDVVNASFEFIAAFVVLSHCAVLRRHKEVRGVSVVAVLFTAVWGAWNVFYYASLHQRVSLLCAVGVVTADSAYAAMLLRYCGYFGVDRSESVL